MQGRLRSVVSYVLGEDRNEQLKVMLLALTFFFVIGGYTLVKELKDTIFANVVGREYIPYAKWLVMFMLVPAILLYSRLVDKVRRYQLLYYYSLFYGVSTLLFAYLLGNPSIGLNNTESSPYRFFGWLFYVFVEGYSPFVLSVFWAFTNSVSSPKSAKKHYGLIVSGSKIGGMLSAGMASIFLGSLGSNLSLAAHTVAHQRIMACSAVMMLMVPVVVLYLMKRVPGNYLHGYEAVYQVEKRKKAEGQHTGLLSGFFFLLRHPYVMGIFGMVAFYEIIITILSYQRVGIAQTHTASSSGMSAFLLQLSFLTHLIGFVISLFGTRTLLERIGERACLLLIPATTALLLIYFVMSPSPFSLMVTFAALRAINYSFSNPIREALYIPTVKEIKFKSKSWIDAFGTKAARVVGSGFNILVSKAPFFATPIMVGFFSIVTACWFATGYLLGRKYASTVRNNEVIGDTAEML